MNNQDNKNIYTVYTEGAKQCIPFDKKIDRSVVFASYWKGLAKAPEIARKHAMDNFREWQSNPDTFCKFEVKRKQNIGGRTVSIIAIQHTRQYHSVAVIADRKDNKPGKVWRWVFFGPYEAYTKYLNKGIKKTTKFADDHDPAHPTIKKDPDQPELKFS